MRSASPYPCARRLRRRRSWWCCQSVGLRKRRGGRRRPRPRCGTSLREAATARQRLPPCRSGRAWSCLRRPEPKLPTCRLTALLLTNLRRTERESEHLRTASTRARRQRWRGCTQRQEEPGAGGAPPQGEVGRPRACGLHANSRHLHSAVGRAAERVSRTHEYSSPPGRVRRSRSREAEHPCGRCARSRGRGGGDRSDDNADTAGEKATRSVRLAGWK